MILPLVHALLEGNFVVKVLVKVLLNGLVDDTGHARPKQDSFTRVSSTDRLNIIIPNR